MDILIFIVSVIVGMALYQLGKALFLKYFSRKP